MNSKPSNKPKEMSVSEIMYKDIHLLQMKRQSTLRWQLQARAVVWKRKSKDISTPGEKGGRIEMLKEKEDVRSERSNLPFPGARNRVLALFKGSFLLSGDLQICWGINPRTCSWSSVILDKNSGTEVKHICRAPSCRRLFETHFVSRSNT